MAVNVNSPEFANAWRLVSEALLEYIQSGGGTQAAMPSVLKECNLKNREPVQDDTTAAVRVDKTIQEVRFAICPIRQDDGSYIFKNLKDSMQEESTYKITRYADGSCEFELCDLQGEQRQLFKDNQTYRMPKEVGSSVGEITRDNVIVTTKKGQGKMEGHSVLIIKPLIVEFKNA